MPRLGRFDRSWVMLGRLALFIVGCVVTLLTAPVLVQNDIPEGFKWWRENLGEFGGSGLQLVVIVVGLVAMAVGVFGTRLLPPWFRRHPPKWRDRVASMGPKQQAYLEALEHEREVYASRLDSWEDRLPRHRLRKRIKEVDERIRKARDEWWEDEGVAVDLRHRRGCPARPSRVETYTTTDAAGIPLDVVHCLDCGELAYRKGSPPMGATEPQSEPPRTAKEHAGPAPGVDVPESLSGTERDELRALIDDGEGLCVVDMDERAVDKWFIRTANWLQGHRQERYARRFDPAELRRARSDGTDALREFVEKRLVDLRVVLTNNMPEGFALDLTPPEALDRYKDVHKIKEPLRSRIRERTARYLRETQR